MNLLICVLLFFACTTSCLNTNQTDGSSTKGPKNPEPMETKLEYFTRHVLIHIIGTMIMIFGFICFCFIHYNCPRDEAVMVPKESVAAKTSRSSKIPFNGSKTASPCVSEKQSVILDIEKLSRPSSPEKLFIPSCPENVIRPPSPEMSSVPPNTEKLIRPSSQEKSSKPSSPKTVFSSPHVEKTRRTCSLDKLHELAGSRKLVSQGSWSYPNIAVRKPCPASLQCPVRQTKPPGPPCPQNQILLLKPTGLPKFTASSEQPNAKSSVGTGVADTLPRPPLIKPCQYPQEQFLVPMNTSESLANDISEPKKTDAQNLPFPHEVKPFSESFQDVDSRDEALYGNLTDSDEMTSDSDDDSDGEITIICNINLSEVIPKGAPNN
ncbi:secreted glycoprotein, X-linked [Rhinolophus ferrumequinum]|uniref:Secreted glycoprotein, X-linked n=2 Tax=Rhinolophus ferrumequinum TaxID=59479 RepID=A0A7J8AUG8_RHIFE|nr:secreted glycoprotein, X-linked [Rhinolophus ferrumequinum]